MPAQWTTAGQHHYLKQQLQESPTTDLFWREVTTRWAQEQQDTVVTVREEKRTQQVCGSLTSPFNIVLINNIRLLAGIRTGLIPRVRRHRAEDDRSTSHLYFYRTPSFVFST